MNDTFATSILTNFNLYRLALHITRHLDLSYSQSAAAVWRGIDLPIGQSVCLHRATNCDYFLWSAAPAHNNNNTTQCPSPAKLLRSFAPLTTTTKIMWLATAIVTLCTEHSLECTVSLPPAASPYAQPIEQAANKTEKAPFRLLRSHCPRVNVSSLAALTHFGNKLNEVMKWMVGKSKWCSLL